MRGTKIGGFVPRRKLVACLFHSSLLFDSHSASEPDEQEGLIRNSMNQ